ncbi:uncharacterized protein LOC143923269 [Arctopsyche grandis]|uniref:uncharacterized protein LOC143923269 n=1 Tax=Arctopsyche grandis TaxID=121162 RepID=UPI00406D84FF
MECRLCLSSSSAESYVPIYEESSSLVQSIFNCCQIQVEKCDGLSDKICSSCESNVLSLTSFKYICIENDKIQRFLEIKTEEVILEDLEWEANGEDNEQKMNTVDQSKSIEIEYARILKQVDSTGVSITNVPKECSEAPKFVCRHCGKSFLKKSDLSTHISTRHKQKPYKCLVCLKLFTTQHSLDEHKQIHCEGDLYKCNKCFKMFSYEFALIEHINTHMRENPYSCEICFKSFQRKTSLVEHKYNHMRTGRINLSEIVQV